MRGQAQESVRTEWIYIKILEVLNSNIFFDSYSPKLLFGKKNDAQQRYWAMAAMHSEKFS